MSCMHAESCAAHHQEKNVEEIRTFLFTSKLLYLNLYVWELHSVSLLYVGCSNLYKYELHVWNTEGTTTSKQIRLEESLRSLILTPFQL